MLVRGGNVGERIVDFAERMQNKMVVVNMYFKREEEYMVMHIGRCTQMNYILCNNVQSERARRLQDGFREEWSWSALDGDRLW